MGRSAPEINSTQQLICNEMRSSKKCFVGENPAKIKINSFYNKSKNILRRRRDAYTTQKFRMHIILYF